MPITTELKMTKVVLVDDHTFVREQLAGLLQAEPDLVVCGQAGGRYVGGLMFFRPRP